jgi:hypothetical protein
VFHEHDSQECGKFCTYFLKNFALYMQGNGMKLLSVVYEHGTLFKEFLDIFFSKKFTHMLGEMNNGDFDGPESLYTKRQKHR